MIYYSTPYRTDKNIGKYYNDFMSLLGENDWACFVDGDTMFTTPFFGKQIEDCIKEDAVYTAVTNRVGTSYQVIGDWNNNDLEYHRKLGQTLSDTKYRDLKDITNESPLSGVLILLSKKLWKEVGGFSEGALGVDNSIHIRAREHSKKVYLMEGVYLLHYYRGGDRKKTDHLKLDEPSNGKYIITANFGDYEDYTPDYFHPGYKHVYFTDRPRHIPNWEVRVIPNEEKLCRKIKTCPHLFLEDIKESYWIDANIRLNKLEVSENDLVLMAHPYRRSLPEELQACLELKKDEPDRMTNQVLEYLKQGYHGGEMVSTGIIYRKHTDKVKELGEFWWNEIKEKSRRDQLSFGYCAWKLNFKYELMPFLHNAYKVNHRKSDVIILIDKDTFLSDLLNKLNIKHTRLDELPTILKANSRILYVSDGKTNIKEMPDCQYRIINRDDTVKKLHKKLFAFIPDIDLDNLINNYDIRRTN